MARRKKSKKLTLRDKAKWIKKNIKKDAFKRESTEFDKKRVLEYNAKKMANQMTKPEREFEKLMKEMGIKYVAQKIIGGFIYDFYLPDHKMLVEVDGDYYHGHPDKYTKDQLNGMQKKNQKTDKEKTLTAKGLGYKIERVWERDINKDFIAVRHRFTKILLS